MARRAARCALLVLTAAVASPLGAEDVAIATEVVGRCATRPGPGQPAREIALYDWVPSGAMVETTAGASLVLAFASGKRWRIGADASVTLAASGISTRRGPVDALPAYPPIPRVEAPAPTARVGARSAAVRVRGQRVYALYPRSPATLMSEDAVLSFQPVSGAHGYRVEVEDESGRSVFQAESRTTAVTVSPGLLRPGGRYFWRVRSVGGVSPPARGEAEFAVPSADLLEARRALEARLLADGAPEAPGVLAEVDRGLGLWRQARARLQSALERAPGDQSLMGMLSRVEAAIAALDEEG